MTARQWARYRYGERGTGRRGWLRVARFMAQALMLSPVTVGASGVWEHAGEGDYVVVVHGMGRTRLAMYPLCRELKKQGYHVLNVGYPSLRWGVEELEGRYLRQAVEGRCGDVGKRIHFVGHSLGNILIRRLLAGDGRPDRLGRVVMLAPPNQGSEVIDEIGGWALSRTLLGPASEELGTAAWSAPNRMGAADYPVAVIMGNKASLPFFRGILRQENDGIVSVERGRLEGMEVFHVCRASHTFIMNNPEARGVLVRYLEGGFPENQEG